MQTPAPSLAAENARLREALEWMKERIRAWGHPTTPELAGEVLVDIDRAARAALAPKEEPTP